MTNPMGSNRQMRLASVVVVGLLSIAAFAAFGGAGSAHTAMGPTQSQYGKKITICHKGKKTIRISLRAWKAHRRHGDTLGTCAEVRRKKDKRQHGSDRSARTEGAPSHSSTADEQAKSGRGNGGKGEGKGHGKGSGKS